MLKVHTTRSSSRLCRIHVTGVCRIESAVTWGACHFVRAFQNRDSLCDLSRLSSIICASNYSSQSISEKRAKQLIPNEYPVRLDYAFSFPIRKRSSIRYLLLSLGSSHGLHTTCPQLRALRTLLPPPSYYSTTHHLRIRKTVH